MDVIVNFFYFSSSVSSRLLPLVSLITNATNIVPNAQIIAYISMHPWRCISSDKIGNNFEEMNANPLSVTMETAKPKLRAFSKNRKSMLKKKHRNKTHHITSVRSDSTMHKYVSETIPTELMNTTKPKLTTGIQLRSAKLYPRELRYMYVAIVDNPMVHPAIEIISSDFRPNVSTNEVELNVPATCSAPNMIDDTCGSIFEFASWKIPTLYTINVKQPQYWFNRVRMMPIKIPLYTAGFWSFRIVMDSVFSVCFWETATSLSYSWFKAFIVSADWPVYPL